MDVLLDNRKIWSKSYVDAQVQPIFRIGKRNYSIHDFDQLGTGSSIRSIRILQKRVIDDNNITSFSELARWTVANFMSIGGVGERTARVAVELIQKELNEEAARRLLGSADEHSLNSIKSRFLRQQEREKLDARNRKHSRKNKAHNLRVARFEDRQQRAS